MSSAAAIGALFLLAGVSGAAAAPSPASTLCVALAADPADIRLPHDAVGIADADVTEAAVSACAAALKLQPDDAQIAYLLGRADLVRGYYADAIANLTTSAQGNYPAAELRLGDIYTRGQGVSADPDAAIAHFVRASDLGDPSGLLGAVKSRIADGADVVKLFPLLQKAGLGGSADAWHLIGEISTKTPPVVPSHAIEQALMTGFAAGDNVAGLELGAFYQRIANLQATTAIYTQLAAAGLPQAMRALGELSNDSASADWLRKAADKGDAQAMYDLATSYRDGTRGLTPDLTARLGLLQSAADAKYLPAIVDLGFAYLQGDGTVVDYDRARGLLEQGAAQKSAGANLGLGFIYEAGNGVTADVKKAYNYYSAAIDTGGLAYAFFHRAVIEDKAGEFHSTDKAAVDFLASGRAAPARATAANGLKAFSPATRAAIQKALITAGKYSGKADGNFGAASTKALLAYWG